MSGTGAQPGKHTIQLEDRKSLTLSGIVDVISFDELSVYLKTAMGNLTVEGEELHINKLSLEDGKVEIGGQIAALFYADGRESEKSVGLLKKMFGKS
ncbi:MAG: sporulation protein YabP [Eubacteriales bacterium]